MTSESGYRTSDAAMLSHRLAAAEAARRAAHRRSRDYAGTWLGSVPLAPIGLVALYAAGGKLLSGAYFIAIVLVIARGVYLSRRADRLEAAYFDALARAARGPQEVWT